MEFSIPLLEGGNCSMIAGIRLYVLKEKIIYINWSKLKEMNRSFYGRFWMPLAHEKSVYSALEELKQRSPNIRLSEI